MGMFDYVIADFECPYCGYKVKKEGMEKEEEYERDKVWQTKATACYLHTYRIGDKLEFEKSMRINNGWIEIVHICPNCDKFVRAAIEVKDDQLSSNIRYIKGQN